MPAAAPDDRPPADESASEVEVAAAVEPDPVAVADAVAAVFVPVAVADATGVVYEGQNRDKREVHLM